jgi:hypothetical protein
MIMMKFRNLSAAIVVAAAITLPALPASAALAGPVRVAYLADNYRTPVTKPVTLKIEQGTVQFLRMSWSQWTRISAVTRSAVLKECSSTGAGCTSRGAKVTLSQPVNHLGRVFFSYLVVTAPRTGERYCYRYTRPRGQTHTAWYQTLASVHGSC